MYRIPQLLLREAARRKLAEVFPASPPLLLLNPLISSFMFEFKQGKVVSKGFFFLFEGGD